MRLLADTLSIFFINLILSGDNAVLIALAVRRLPQTQRRQGIAFGAGTAVVLRIVLTFFVAQLLQMTFVRIVGGALILWIAFKLLIEGAGEEGQQEGAGTLWQAIRTIVIADLTMSLDNVLAVAGASHGSLFLLVLGLLLSVPIVVFASNMLSSLMDRYPIVVILGAAILGKVGGEMLLTDRFVEGFLHPSKAFGYAIQLMFAVGVVVAGRLWLKMKSSDSSGDLQIGEEKVLDLSLTISRN